jgi:hypothetical protein
MFFIIIYKIQVPKDQAKHMLKEGVAPVEGAKKAPK